ncbi:hypothetical protein PPERSA_10911 [Pseudocohnilembus persalinus]|uniref:Transmembrane protein n=1 Tax=Pseudocohnilembus persalinus TaxID=266149 RepID=A0A0V0RAA3_PSEPJ|nr:hypothetical protein PPERSA_10911 [Pseudocohnilembus persalinus]|eukprot:KRX11144.1 hypothetical protein PPERSA_10911 [Pseudocohnilembus persalinus]
MTLIKKFSSLSGKSENQCFLQQQFQFNLIQYNKNLILFKNIRIAAKQIQNLFQFFQNQSESQIQITITILLNRPNFNFLQNKFFKLANKYIKILLIIKIIKIYQRYINIINYFNQKYKLNLYINYITFIIYCLIKNIQIIYIYDNIFI